MHLVEQAFVLIRQPEMQGGQHSLDFFACRRRSLQVGDLAQQRPQARADGVAVAWQFGAGPGQQLALPGEVNLVAGVRRHLLLDQAVDEAGTPLALLRQVNADGEQVVQDGNVRLVPFRLAEEILQAVAAETQFGEQMVLAGDAERIGLRADLTLRVEQFFHRLAHIVQVVGAGKEP